MHCKPHFRGCITHGRIHNRVRHDPRKSALAHVVWNPLPGTRRPMSGTNPGRPDFDGLVYTHDRMPGYRRRRCGRGFAYFSPGGNVLKNGAEIARIRSLAVPPAYEDVWICRLPNGHLQATGIDARKRKQYRYHPLWLELANETKFGELPDFVRALPVIRSAVRRELSRESLTRDRVIAGVVAMLELTGYRVGSRRYARDNGTFGIASLLTRHIKAAGDHVEVVFPGKAGAEHHAEIDAPRLLGLINELQELPGQHLFRYCDDAGECHDIGTADVNEWLKQAAGGDFTAKQFRTWKATLLCARALATAPPPTGRGALRRAMALAIGETAAELNHTPAVCRKYYIHPALNQSFADGELFRIMHTRAPRLRRSDGTASLHADERRVYRILTRVPSGRLRKKVVNPIRANGRMQL
jgi:DNA topoisomerase I